MLDHTLTQHIENLTRGEYTSEELTRAYLSEIESQSSLNCFVSVSETAIEQAKAADQRRQAGDTNPMLGVPVAHKDIFCETDVRTTAGSRMLDNFVAPYDATVVSKLKDAGVISLGKTNMDEFAMGSSNENSYYGAVRNPWNTSCVPGGSSGGSAAAVAARLCAAATGTDTGGSIRQPAGFCGITGIKPTYGRISRWGMIAYASSLDQAGPMAQSAEDCAHLLQVMAGHDEKDSTSSPAPANNYIGALGTPLDGLKVGVCKEYMEGLSEDAANRINDTIAVLTAAGASTQEISLPNAHLAIPAYYIIAPAECSANLSRYDGVRFGYRCEDPESLEDLYKRSRTESLGQEVKNRIMVGAFALSAGYYDAYYRKAQQIRRLIKDDFARAFKDVDLIIAPTSPAPAFEIGAKTDDAQDMYLQDIYTISANLAGLPAISFPAEPIGGMPFGIQLMGNYFREDSVLNAAHAFQQSTEWHLARPGVTA